MKYTQTQETNSKKCSMHNNYCSVILQFRNLAAEQPINLNKWILINILGENSPWPTSRTCVSYIPLEEPQVCLNAGSASLSSDVYNNQSDSAETETTSCFAQKRCIHHSCKWSCSWTLWAVCPGRRVRSYRGHSRSCAWGMHQVWRYFAVSCRQCLSWCCHDTTCRERDITIVMSMTHEWCIHKSRTSAHGIHEYKYYC